MICLGLLEKCSNFLLSFITTQKPFGEDFFYCDIVITFNNCQSCLASLRMVSSLRKLTDCI